MTTPDNPTPLEHERISAELAAVLALLEDVLTSAEQWELQGNIDGGEYSAAFQALWSIVEERRKAVPAEATALLADVGQRLASMKRDHEGEAT